MQSNTLKNMAQQFGINEETVRKVLATGLLMIIDGLNKNIQQREEVKSLNKAL